MIQRNLAAELTGAATRAPAITLTGPRQSGKTTLCRSIFPEHPYVSLESPDERAFATDDPRAFLEQFPEGAILDEVQRVPELLSYLQGFIDNDPTPGRWVLTGSQNFSLLESVNQSLAGRIEIHQLLPLTWDEIRRFPKHPASLEEVLFSGSYPRIFDQKPDPPVWLRSYVATYLERDVRTLSNIGDLITFQRFVELCAGRTAQLLNYSSLAKGCGISQPTAKAWLGILEASYIAFRLPAFSANPSKRLIKMPKLYFYDTGLACWLLGIRQPEQLRSHPLRGAIFETWVVSEILKHRIHEGADTSTVHGFSFYRDKNGAEVDLLMENPDRLTLLEAKSAETPSKNLFDGARRVQRHFKDSPRPCDVVIAYGGEEFQQRTDGRLIPWRMLRMVVLPGAKPSVHVFADGEPIADADVQVLFPNKTLKRTTTDENGKAYFDLHTSVLPVTVFVAANGFEAQVIKTWQPAECALHIELRPQLDGNESSSDKSTEDIMYLQEHPNPIRNNTFSRPHPLSTEAAVASLKRYLAEPRYQIQLSDLIKDTVERVVTMTSNEVFAAQNNLRPTTELVTECVRKYEDACKTLLAMALVGGQWAKKRHYLIWQEALQRLDSRTLSSDYVLWSGLQRYPATLLLYALGLGAVQGNRLRFLSHILTVPLYKNQEEISAVQVLPPSCLFNGGQGIMNVLEGMENYKAPLSVWILKALQPYAERIIPDADRYALAFDKLDILMALSHIRQTSWRPPPLGPFTYQEKSRNRILREIKESLSTEQAESRFVTCSIFGRTVEDCEQGLEDLEQVVEKSYEWRRY